MDEETALFFHCGLVAWHVRDFFNSHEMERSSGQSMDPTIGVQNVLATTIVDEIRLPTTKERATLGTHLPKLQICIWFIDGTLVEI
jgi:hypothetical protein